MWKYTPYVAVLLGFGLQQAAAQVAAPAAASQPAATASAPSTSTAPAAKRILIRSKGAASTKPWPSKRFTYKADGKRISDVLHDFASSQDLPAIVADGVEGIVQANFDSPPEEFLNAISKAYGILWYHDGTALYFYPSKAIQSRLFRIKGFSRSQVEELLDSLQVGDKRYPLRYSPLENTLLVYGPPRHVDLVAAALDSLDAGAIERNSRVVRVFPLRFASAQDRRYGESVIPGMANILRSIYGPQATTENKPAAPSNSSPSAQKVRSMASMFGTTGRINDAERRSADATGAASAEKSTMGIAPRGMQSPIEDEDDGAIFQADEGTNAIIVRGRLDRMADYGAVIQRLDVRPTLVEIEAMIIDVSSDSVNQLGIAWTATGNKGRVSVTPIGTPSAAAAQSVPNSFSVSTLWANSGRELLTRVDALQAHGKARIVAKPKVLGVANRPAIMKENRIVNVRVASNLDANLFRIEAGTQLQVTPQVTTMGDTARIKLSLYIVDGNFEESSVDSVPIVKHTEIVTEAHVTEGESLLIGGITVDSNTSQKSGVPGLSKIPLIGGLFRWTNGQVKRSERLFLITPRLIRDVSSLPESAPTSPAPAPAPAPSAPVMALPPVEAPVFEQPPY